ncbi:hypothetical protein SAMN05444156_3229 [Verrucomicrobium sp. GAS474]|uniref:hypothetical protein n=1 Tax=Verrucomicrobium sp. GAS474 TaxID=1882831 RepID=UPI00087D5F4E|nr:hypothetical protein [Verrucomicrobium sp. GAS474]SDU31241.1 hypothetical protein SAMN05444156_3229 [Verrucomicrobium sp. GAS474]
MTLPELIAKMTGLEGELTALKANASASTAESATLRASLAEATAQIAKLKAEAPEEGDSAPDASGGISESVKAIENAISTLQGVLKDISSKVGADAGDAADEDADAEAGDDADMEAKAGNWPRALALRQRQLKKLTARVARKTATAQSKEAFDKAVAAASAAQISALGIETPLAISSDPNQSPAQKIAASIKPGTHGRGTKIAAAAFNASPEVEALNRAFGRKAS